jgi:amino-acid N-acetyltransferase
MPTRPVATIRHALPADRPAVEALLREAGLPLDGLDDAWATAFLVAESDGQVVGAIGLEQHGEHLLMRSAVVQAAARGEGLGHRLVEHLLVEAQRRDARDVWLLTTTAERWFPRFGFARSMREEVPWPLQSSRELRGACPDSAIVMRRALDSNV